MCNIIINMSDKQAQPINNNVVACNDTSFSGYVSDYKKAISDWKTKTDNYWSARESGGVFLCVEPPPKPKFEDFIS